MRLRFPVPVAVVAVQDFRRAIANDADKAAAEISDDEVRSGKVERLVPRSEPQIPCDRAGIFPDLLEARIGQRGRLCRRGLAVIVVLQIEEQESAWTS